MKPPVGRCRLWEIIVVTALLAAEAVYGATIMPPGGFGPNAIEANGVIFEVLTNEANTSSKNELGDRGRMVNGVWIGEEMMGSARTNTEGTPLTFTTEAYNRAALRELLQEANTIAQALSLPEWLPIKEENIVDVFIVPYGITRHRPMIGRIYTKNYAYFASVGYKMSYVEGTHQDRDCLKWMEQFKWPRSRVNTNAAFQLATHWMAAASMDVTRLNRDCDIRVEPEPYWNAANPNKQTTFIPIYYVCWKSREKISENYASVASVKLFAPTKSLISLRVEESKYILRKPLTFTNLDVLLAVPEKK